MSESAGAEPRTAGNWPTVRRHAGRQIIRRAAAGASEGPVGDVPPPRWAAAAGSAMPLAERLATASKEAPAAAPAAPTGQLPSSAIEPASIGRWGVQRKAVVGAVDDPLERHAEAVADRVVSRAAGATPAPAAATADVPSVDPARPPAPAPAAPPAPSTVSRATATGGAVQADSAGGSAGGELSESTETLLNAERGGGTPLPPDVRTEFEQSLGVDLSAVRIHTDSSADLLAGRLGALAFTRGQDIFFRSGTFDPAGETGRRLLAHELAHVQQQTDGRSVPRDGPVITIHRAGTTAIPPKSGPKGGGSKGKNPPVLLEKLEVPSYKIDAEQMKAAPELIKLVPGVRDDQQTSQATKWKGKAREKVKQALKSKIADLPGTSTPTAAPTGSPGAAGAASPAPASGTTGLAASAGGQDDGDQEEAETAAANAGEKRYYFELKVSGAKQGYLFGTEAGLVNKLTRPSWNEAGVATKFDVDHVLEMQMGGVDEIENMWLLDEKSNRSAGSSIKNSRNAIVDAMLGKGEIVRADGTKPKKHDEVYAEFDVFAVKSKLARTSVSPTIWELKDLATPKLVAPLIRLDQTKVSALADSEHFSLFSTVNGGPFRAIKKTDKVLKAEKHEHATPTTINLLKWEGNPGRDGDLLGTLDYQAPTGLEPKSFSLNIKSLKDIERAGYVSTRDQQVKLSLFSPIQWSALEFDVNQGLIGRGTVLTDRAPLNKHVDMGVLVGGKGVGVFASILGTGLDLPGPFKVAGGYIGMEYWFPKTLTAEGQIDFALGTLATGFVQLRAGAGENPISVVGKVNFDTDIFTKATLGVEYTDGEWKFDGELAIGPDKVSGIKAASAKVEYGGGELKAIGTVEPALKGIEKGSLRLGYTQATGAISVEGILAISKFPGVDGGEIKARVDRSKTGAGWTLGGAITAKPSVPGVSGQITGEYQDGLFFAQADLAYQRGMLSGRLKIAATNQDVGPDGKPNGKPTPTLVVFGMSELALQLTPWLIGKAGVELKRNGTIAVVGSIGLPPEFELFKAIDKSQLLFKAGTSFPLFAGVIARIAGQIDLFGTIGPGKLLGTAITVTYDPDKEDATTVRGETRLVIPARAGLRVSVEAGLGIGVPGLSVTGNLVVAGELGVAGALEAAAAMLWTRSGGLVLDAEAKLSVSPMFRLTLGAKIVVEAAFWEVYSRTWTFAAFDYGSGLTFGIVLPVHAEQGKFDFSMDKVRFIYPQVDADSLAKGVINSKMEE